MEVQVDVNPVPLAELDGLIDLFEDRFAHCAQIFGVRPTAIGEGQADKIESPLGHRREVALGEGAIVLPVAFLEQVEAAPARQFGRCRLLVGRAVGGDGTRRRQSGPGLKKLSPVHVRPQF
jgi:hypothetical protein